MARQAEKLRNLIQKYLQEKNLTLEKFKEHLVDLLSENLILVESDADKIKSEGFDLEKYSTSFISDLLDILLNKNINEQELNNKLQKIFVEFLGLAFNELKKVYTSEREGALYYFSENIREFIEKNFGEEAIDNLMEINDDVFAEMVSNGVDIYEQIQKNETLKKKISEQVNSNSNNQQQFVKSIIIIFLEN